LTLFVESNFVLEIALGQEELAFAERLLAAAESSAIDLAIPSFSLSEPFARVTRGNRDRRRLMSQLGDQVTQLARSTVHRTEVDALRAIPALVTRIDDRERVRLAGTIERLLATARLIELDLAAFRVATNYRDRYDLQIEDAIILAVVVADLNARPGSRQHLFANRNRRDFRNLALVTDLRRLGCDVVWSFADAARLLGVR
jgi:hypothetical protein